MNTQKLFSAAFMAAAFAVIYVPVEKVLAQAQDENRLSIPIEMVVNAGTSEERQQTSQYGTMDPVALRPNEQVAITLISSVNLRGSPVGIAPLDGGAIFGAKDLKVAEDGTAGFTFGGGDSPGFYYVLVTIEGEQYQLQFYVLKPKQPDTICP
jgi:hypothetical protein